MTSALLFDLDGTLIDSKPGIVACFRHALSALETQCPSDQALCASIGQPFRQAFAEFLGTTDPEAVERAVIIYRERYATIGLYEADVYAGVRKMLRMLDGAPAYIATSKASVYASRVVEHFGLTEYFRGIYGPDLGGRPGHKSAIVEHVIRREELAGHAIMIGDRADDILAAKANNIESIGVLWGYGTRDELVAAGADALVDTPESLVEYLRRRS